MDAVRKAIEDRINSLAKDGRLTVDDVLEDARNPTSPLHQRFEWDNAKAAEEHRREQARELIRSVKIEERVEERTISVVRYVRDPTTTKGYIETLRLKDSKDLAREAIRDEIVRVVAALGRAQDLADVLGVGEEVRDIIQLVSDLRRRVAA